jgi:Na+-transporting NADH:ubiquinone oxidoreductase subunit NqrF
MTVPWNYHSVIGKLAFLAQNTRPNISFAVHQCAPFVQAPRKSHEEAVKYLCQYLLKTGDKGMILHPYGKHPLTTHVDADLWFVFAQQHTSVQGEHFSDRIYHQVCQMPNHLA